LTRIEKVDRLLEELRREGIHDPRVLGAIAKVPRDLFVPEESRRYAYLNAPLSIGAGQTISQPFVVALMTQALALTGSETVLEVGTGSGYQCAILAELCHRVVSVERIESLHRRAADLLARLGYDNVELVLADGTLGWVPRAPYGAVLVTAACPRVPPPLTEQLAEGGRIVVPVGSPDMQELVMQVRRGNILQTEKLGAVRFVPLIGEQGWHEPQE
jgi:protein-L-isoaspartate(D-aspartate) O-methyltransferase